MGIIGDPIAHSLSPQMHNAAFGACGLNWRCLAFRVPPRDLASALRGIAAMGFAGLNVTLPHKEPVLALLDDVDEGASLIGTVNTIRVEDGRLRGFNTDGDGLLDALRHDGGVRVQGTRCLVLGAGGGARAAAFALARAGAASVVVLNRTPARAEDLARRVADAVRGCDLGAGSLDAVTAARWAAEAGIIIQATSATMSAAMGGEGGRAPWLQAVAQALRQGVAVLDMVYTPRWTELLAAARAARAVAVSGLAMLIYQGARSFELWTGRPAPIEVMRAALEDAEKLKS